MNLVFHLLWLAAVTILLTRRTLGRRFLLEAPPPTTGEDGPLYRSSLGDGERVSFTHGPQDCPTGWA